LVVRHEAVPARDLDAAAFVALHDAVPNDEQPDAQEVHAVPREALDLAVVYDDRIFFRTVLLSVVQKDAMDRFLCIFPSLQEKAPEMHAKCDSDVEHAVCLVGVE